MMADKGRIQALSWRMDKFTKAAKMGECVFARIMFLQRSIKQPEGQVEPAAWEKLKRQGRTRNANVGQWKPWQNYAPKLLQTARSTEHVTKLGQEGAVLYHTAASCKGEVKRLLVMNGKFRIEHIQKLEFTLKIMRCLLKHDNSFEKEVSKASFLNHYQLPNLNLVAVALQDF